MNPVLGVSTELEGSVVRKHPEAKKLLKGAIEIFRNLRQLDRTDLPPAKRRKIESLIEKKSNEQLDVAAKLESERALAVQLLAPVRRVTSGYSKLPDGSPVSPLTPLPPIGEIYFFFE